MPTTAIALDRRQQRKAQDAAEAGAFAELRADGLTLRAIAAAAGVSIKTVHRDLDDESTLSDDKVARTLGKDGKARPTRYKPRAVGGTA